MSGWKFLVLEAAASSSMNSRRRGEAASPYWPCYRLFAAPSGER